MLTYHVRMSTSNAELSLIAALSEYLGDDFRVYDCLELQTDRPDIAATIEALFHVRPIREDQSEAAAVAPVVTAEPAAAPAPKRRARTPKLQYGSDGSAPISDDVQQSFRWRIVASGKECNSISKLLALRKLQVGAILCHRENGKYEVIETNDGRLTTRKLPNGNGKVAGDGGMRSEA